jgi:hypothetical protein
MQASPPPHPDIFPWAPYRCPRCRRCDTIPMPAEHLLDKMIGCFRLAPYKCRACKAKFYRHAMATVKAAPPAEESAPPRNVAVCHRDPAETLRRVETIIRNAEGRRLPRG